METHIPLSAWAEDDRPREKMMLKGKQSLSDAELLAILLGSGRSGETAVDLARRILTGSENSLDHMSRLSIADLCKYKGIGEAKAITILAALELGRRRKKGDSREPQKISNSEEAVRIFQPMLGDLLHEEFWVLFLNRANKVIGKQQISSGGMSGTVADPRMIFRAALDQKAVSVIMCHNHPSGNTKPSNTDIQLTKNMIEAGRVLEINVLDHIIVTQHGFFSFADEGLI